MNRRILPGLALLLVVGLVVALILHAASGPPPGRMLVAGDVRAVTRTVSAPAILRPTINSTVLVPSNAAQGTSVTTLTVTGGALAPNVCGTLVRVYAAVGDHVTTGAVLAQLDTRALDIGVRQAALNAAASRTKVKVIKNNLQTIYDNIDKLSTGWSQLATGRAQLATAKKQLAAAKAQLLAAKAQLLAAQKKLLSLKKQRPQLEAQLAQLEQQAATYPPNPVPPALLQQIAKLKGLLASIDPGLAQISANLKKVDAGLAKLAVGEVQLVTGQAALATGAAQLATASSALHDAKTQVIRARDSLQIVADASHLQVTLAEVRRDQATITSPVSGIVTQAVRQGATAMVGAPLFRIRPDQQALVDTYLTGDQLTKVRLGTLADITYDSGDGAVLHGRLHLIDDQALYPPTSFPTNVVHMTDTVKLTFQLDSGANPPPQGTPVDIAIHTD